MKSFSCRDAGQECDWTVQGQSDDEILSKVESHARDYHKDLSWTDEVKAKMKSLIKPITAGKSAAASY